MSKSPKTFVFPNAKAMEIARKKLIPTPEQRQNLVDSQKITAETINSTKKQVIPFPRQKIQPSQNVTITEMADTTNPSIQYTAKAMQCIGNAFNRQAASNLGLLALSKEKVNVDFKFLFGGISSRIAYNFGAIMPSLLVRQKMDESGKFSKWEIVAASTTTETVIGTFFEVNGARNALKQMGIEITSKDLAKISARVFTPFLLRNSLTWAVASAIPDDVTLTGKAAIGGVAGAISIAPHNIGQAFMMKGSQKTAREAFSEICDDITKDPKMLLKGIHIRTLAGIAGAIILSRDAGEFFQDSLKKVAESITKLGSEVQSNETTDSTTQTEFDKLPNPEKIKTLQSIVKSYTDIAQELSPEQKTPGSTVNSPSAGNMESSQTKTR